jgi:hypothetical protein
MLIEEQNEQPLIEEQFDGAEYAKQGVHSMVDELVETHVAEA